MVIFCPAVSPQCRLIMSLLLPFPKLSRQMSLRASIPFYVSLSNMQRMNYIDKIFEINAYMMGY